MANWKCNKCEKDLDPGKIVWLEYSNTDDKYYEKVPEGHDSLGHYPFGSACAKKQLKE